MMARFRIDAELARGGAAGVYAAFDTAANRRVALKRLKPNADLLRGRRCNKPVDLEWSDGKRAVRLLYVDWMAR